MSQLSIDNALNVLGIPKMSANLQALEAAYADAIKAYDTTQGPASDAVHQLLKVALISLQHAGEAAQKAPASDPGYATRFDEALSWLTRTPLSFEILGAWLWVWGAEGTRSPFESELQACGFEWASKKACCFLKPQASSHPEPTREPWDLERIRSAYAYRAA